MAQHTSVSLPLAPLMGAHVLEDVLGDELIDSVVAQARQAHPDMQIHRVNLGAYEPGWLAITASPSLFGEPTLIVATHLEKLSVKFQDEFLTYLRAPEPDIYLLITRHGAGDKNRAIMDALKKAKAPLVTIEAIKTARDKQDFVIGRVRAAGRDITPGAVGALIDAVGSDLRELAVSVDQLLTDIEGRIDDAAVAKYYAGRIEATGFAVADAVTAGNPGRAIALARHAVATGTSEVAILAAITLKIRNLIKVGAGITAGMAPWQIDRARREVRSWTSEGLARALETLAQADAEVKGFSRDKMFALENAILTLETSRRA